MFYNRVVGRVVVRVPVDSNSQKFQLEVLHDQAARSAGNSSSFVGEFMDSNPDSSHYAFIFLIWGYPTSV